MRLYGNSRKLGDPLVTLFVAEELMKGSGPERPGSGTAINGDVSWTGIFPLFPLGESLSGLIEQRDV